MDIFIYGTLMSPDLRRAVAGGAQISTVAAELDGYEVLPAAGHVVPLIRAAPAGRTTGQIMLDIDAAQRARLDAYESAFGYRLIEVAVRTAAGLRDVAMYLPPQDSAVGAGDWSLEAWAQHHESPAVLAATELFAYQPALSRAEIRQRWHMFEKRAWAKTRAKAQNGQGVLRHTAGPDDVTLVSQAPPQGYFYSLQAIELTHHRFDGQRSKVLPREVFVGIDAVLVLPYDVSRDRVLLVEQLRVGPVVRDDPQPWILEPVAGMVDARETPRDAALRESREEARLSDLELVEIAAFYPSPGSSTDYFHSYLGLCDLPDDHAAFGGLEEEAEDLRLHILRFDQAMALVKSGEINAGPLIMMLFYLAAERSTLRATG
uniref:NUDIX domain-containing protein n=1 Tax=Yoonia sp. TaxID=2212373 RepID=UPI00404821EC